MPLKIRIFSKTTYADGLEKLQTEVNLFLNELEELKCPVVDIKKEVFGLPNNSSYFTHYITIIYKENFTKKVLTEKQT